MHFIAAKARKYAFNYHLRCNLSEVLVSLVFNENWFSDCITPKAKDNGNFWFFPETFSHHMFLRRSRRHRQPPRHLICPHGAPGRGASLLALKVILMNGRFYSWAWLTRFAAKWASPRKTKEGLNFHCGPQAGLMDTRCNGQKSCIDGENHSSEWGLLLSARPLPLVS